MSLVSGGSNQSRLEEVDRFNRMNENQQFAHMGWACVHGDAKQLEFFLQYSQEGAVTKNNVADLYALVNSHDNNEEVRGKLKKVLEEGAN